MPKVTVEFNLPEEQEEFDLVSNSSKFYSVIWDLTQFLRSEWKYNDEAYTDAQYETLEKIRSKVWELISENGLSDQF